LKNEKPIDWREVEPEKRRLALSTLRFGPDTQPRESIDEEWVERYAERMSVDSSGLIVDDEGDRFPPITVFYDGDNYWVADGHHRGRAAKEIGADQIQVELYQGDKRDAILYAASANADHGKPRESGDIKRIAYKLLLDDEWRHWADREIARQCRIERSRVNEIRRELLETDEEYREDVGDTRKYFQDGEIREMDISNMGDNSTDEDETLSWEPAPSGQETDEGADADSDDDDDTGGLSEDSGGYRDETNFQEIPGALPCASYAQYDPIGETTVATGCDIREALEFIAPIDLIVSHGPDDPSEYKSWVDAAAHTIDDAGVLVAILSPERHAQQSETLSKRFTHQHTQLLDTGQSWQLASFWHHSLGLPNRADLGGRGWSTWASTLYQSTMSTIALPYARNADIAAGLLGPDREITVLTDSEEDVDAITANL